MRYARGRARHRKPPPSARGVLPALLLAAVLVILVGVLIDATRPGRLHDHVDSSAVVKASGHGTDGQPGTRASNAALPITDTEVTARLGQLLAQRPASEVSIAAANLTTGQAYRYPMSAAVRTASVVKLDILEALLLRHQQTGQPLDDVETKAATSMIEVSDNTAADTAWNEIGGADGLSAANRQLGTTNTTPQTDGYWGLTTSDADDQLVLLRNLVNTSPLGPDSRSFALSLLRGVASDQAWGISVAADPGSTPAIKNGWLDVDDDNGLWVVGSVGMISIHGQPILIAVLTQHNPSEQDGITLIQTITTTILPAISAARSPESQ